MPVYLRIGFLSSYTIKLFDNKPILSPKLDMFLIQCNSVSACGGAFCSFDIRVLCQYSIQWSLHRQRWSEQKRLKARDGVRKRGQDTEKKTKKEENEDGP